MSRVLRGNPNICKRKNEKTQKMAFPIFSTEKKNQLKLSSTNVVWSRIFSRQQVIFLLGNGNGEGQSYKPNCVCYKINDQNFSSERSTEENTEEKEAKRTEEEKREKMKMSKELTVSASNRITQWSK